ncbi:MAG TPA: thioredoxin domain-containing protein [Candidatus Angelobacter sp.]
MARKKLAYLNVFLFLILAACGCKAQSTNAVASISPDVLHRIQNEIRSRYSVAPQVDISISAPEASDVPGYDKVIVTFAHDAKKTTFDFLVSKDRKTLARLEKIDISQDLMSKIDVKGRPVRGSEAAKVVIVNYDDFQCPYCAKMHASLFPGLLKEYGGRVKFIYKDYPLIEIHPWAMHAAIDANCLADQNGDAYWDFADYVHANARTIGGHTPQETFGNLDKLTTEQGEKHHLNGQKLEACVKKSDESAVRASMSEADKLGVDATPTLFINGERISGIVPDDVMHSIIDHALADAGEKMPSANAKN